MTPAINRFISTVNWYRAPPTRRVISNIIITKRSGYGLHVSPTLCTCGYNNLRINCVAPVITQNHHKPLQYSYIATSNIKITAHPIMLILFLLFYRCIKDNRTRITVTMKAHANPTDSEQLWFATQPPHRQRTPTPPTIVDRRLQEVQTRKSVVTTKRSSWRTKPACSAAATRVLERGLLRS